MYLTRLRLDPRSVQARRDLANPYDMHRTLVRAFVTGDHEKPPRFLWRLEPVSSWSEPVLLVQSDREGDWSALDILQNYLKKQAETKFLDWQGLLHANSCYRFRLCANPTVTRNGKRYGLPSEEAQLQWLTRQGERASFRIETGLVISSDVLKTRKANIEISLQRAYFEGILQVVDPMRMTDALVAGIGPGKAFGCGLLSIARC